MVKSHAEKYSFYEFFAGSGMVRAGLGSGWTCMFANDLEVDMARDHERKQGPFEPLLKASWVFVCLRQHACESSGKASAE